MEELFEIDLASVPRFLARWYGPPDRGSTPVTRPDLPPALQVWYEATSAYSRAVTGQNRVLGPGEVVLDDDKLIFWLENQHVYEWAAETGEDNPPVFERSTSVGEPWHPTGVRLTEFMVTVAVFEAIMIHSHTVHGTELTTGQVTAAVAPLRPLPVPGPVFGGQLYATADTSDDEHTIAFATPAAPEDHSTWWVWIAAQDPTRLAYLGAIAEFLQAR